MAGHAADLIAVLDHLGVGRAVLAGHSHGAYIVARPRLTIPTASLPPSSWTVA